MFFVLLGFFLSFPLLGAGSGKAADDALKTYCSATSAERAEMLVAAWGLRGTTGPHTRLRAGSRARRHSLCAPTAAAGVPDRSRRLVTAIVANHALMDKKVSADTYNGKGFFELHQAWVETQERLRDHYTKRAVLIAAILANRSIMGEEASAAEYGGKAVFELRDILAEVQRRLREHYADGAGGAE